MRPLRTGSGSTPGSLTSENLMLDEPALSTRIASVIGASHHRHRRRLALRVRDQRRDRARRESRFNGVGSARENDRHARAEHNARAVGIGEKRHALPEHVARLQVRHYQHVSATGPGRMNFFDMHERAFRFANVEERLAWLRIAEENDEIDWMTFTQR